ncbi:family 43 glycosylhydrolase, partial [Actinoplanes rectilineatus]|uniref:family 43 glycosylhydrolase n=1 Tax=Actinoplanes rectilineatus TaxID=113571 RepID=UPI0005F2B3E5
MRRISVLAAVVVLFVLAGVVPAQAAQTGIRAADPSVIRVGSSTYVGVQSYDGGIGVRTATSPDALASSAVSKVWSDTAGFGEVWAPEVVYDGGRYYIYFAAGTGAAHRMYVISSTAATSGYTAATKLNLPDDKWAIDGILVTFNSQRWFVWSGWAGDTNVEQNLYIARMSSPTTATGARYAIA